MNDNKIVLSNFNNINNETMNYVKQITGIDETLLKSWIY
jgi:hypothetical protein